MTMQQTAIKLDMLASMMKHEEANLKLGIHASYEGALDVIKDAGLRIIELIYNLYQKMINAIVQTRNQSENRTVYAKQLLERLKDIPDKSSVSKIKFPDIHLLSKKGELPTQSSLLKDLRYLREVFYIEAIENTEYTINVLDKAFPKIDTLLVDYSKLPLDSITRLVQLIAEDSNVLRKQYLKSRYLKKNGSSQIYGTEDFLGMGKVSYYIPAIDESALRSTNAQLVDLLSDIGNLRGDLITSPLPESTLHEVLPFNKSSQEELLKECIEVLKILSSFHIRFYSKIDNLRNKVKHYRDRYNALSKDNQNDTAKVYLRRISKILHALNRWLYSPAMPLVGHTLRVCDAIIHLCEKSQREILRA